MWDVREASFIVEHFRNVQFCVLVRTKSGVRWWNSRDQLSHLPLSDGQNVLVPILCFLWKTKVTDWSGKREPLIFVEDRKTLSSRGISTASYVWDECKRSWQLKGRRLFLRSCSGRKVKGEKSFSSRFEHLHLGFGNRKSLTLTIIRPWSLLQTLHILSGWNPSWTSRQVRPLRCEPHTVMWQEQEKKGRIKYWIEKQYE